MSAALMAEDDGDEGHLPSAAVEIPAGLSGSSDAPRGRAAEARDEPEYHIVETDDEFRPLTGPGAQPRQEIRQEDPTDDAPGRERQTKAERRQAQRAARERSESELRTLREEKDQLRRSYDELAAKVQSIEPRLSEFDQSRFNDQVAGLTREIDASAAAVENAIARMSEAFASGDANAHGAAMRDHTKAVQRGYELAQKRERLEASRQGSGAPQDRQPVAQPRPQEQPRLAPPQADPEVTSKVRDFNSKHPWIDLQKAADRDSQIALVIDREVYSDGFDPRDADYYEELEARLREALPRRFETQAPTRPTQPARQAQPQVLPQRRGPMVAGGGGGAPPSGPRTVLLSPERKAALMEVGALDREGRVADKAKFNRIAKGYEQFDRENASGAARQ